MAKKNPIEQVDITKEKLHEAVMKSDNDLYDNCNELAKVLNNDDVFLDNSTYVTCNNYTDTIADGVPICNECLAKFNIQLKVIK